MTDFKSDDILEVCQGCLSTDRHLTSLGKYKELFSMMILTKPTRADNRESKCVCWECYKILQNIHNFQLRVTEAQKVLSDAETEIQYATLSNLRIVCRNDYQICSEYDGDEQKLNNVKVEVVKEETNKDSPVSHIPEDNREPFDIELEIKGEIKDIIDTHNDLDDDHFSDGNNFEVQTDEYKNDTKESILQEILNHSQKAKPKITRNRGTLLKKYNTILFEDVKNKMSLFDKVTLDEEGLKLSLENKRQTRNYVTMDFKCEKCFSGFPTKENYDNHVRIKHAATIGKYKCDICEYRFNKKQNLTFHMKDHYTQYVCRLCSKVIYQRFELYTHLKHGPHGKMLECKKCHLWFDCRNRKMFFEHYKLMHETFICDVCGHKAKTKHTLQAHIENRHTIYLCKPCNVTYSSKNALKRHRQFRHEQCASELTYCVECDVQFDNPARYTEHIKRSVKHIQKPKIPCLACDKTYTKRSFMMNHYNLVHLKKSKNYCALCDTYFLNGYRLRYHQKYFHDKLPKPKTKICTYCGRAFGNNRILDNHIRTHTGERPFTCTVCDASFTQKTALITHARAQHAGAGVE